MAGMIDTSAAPRAPFRMGWQQKAALLALLAYCIWALSTMGVNSDRLANGWNAASKFVGMMFPPQMNKMDELWQGLKETMQIAVLATTVGTSVVFARPALVQACMPPLRMDRSFTPSIFSVQ